MDRSIADACNKSKLALVAPDNWACGTAPCRYPPIGAREIELLLSERIASRHERAPSIAVRGPLIANDFARIFRGEGAMFPGPVVIKQFLQGKFGGTPTSAARTYFSALSKLSGIDVNRDLGISQPLALLDTYGIVVASWIEGPSLTKWLFQASTMQRQHMLCNAGKWLARLHYTTEPLRQQPNLLDALGRLEDEITASGSASEGLPRSALALLRTSAPALEGQSVCWSHLHGDFKPANLIVRDARLFGIDLDLSIVAPVVNDVAHFLNHLQLMFYSPRAWLRRPRVGLFVEAFCEGYDSEATYALTRRLVVWQQLHNAVHLLLGHREWSRPTQVWPVRFALQHLIRSLSKSLLRQGSRADSAT